MAKLKDKLIEAAGRVWNAWRKWGPVDDGRPEGDEFDEALMNLRIVARRSKIQSTAERKALVNIVNAANEVGNDPIHFKVKEAIAAASKILDYSDMEVEE